MPRLPPRAALYRTALRARARRRALADAAATGFWLGTMDRAALIAVDELFFTNVREPIAGVGARYADDAHIASGLHAWEHTAIAAAFPEHGRVVVTAAGAGREVLGLLELGYDAVGHEPHAGLVAAGNAALRRRGRPDALFPCARDVFPADAGRADALVVGWGSYMLIPGTGRRRAFLRGARATLPAGAPLLLSFFVRRPERRLRVVRAVAAAVRRLRRAEAPELGDDLVPNFVHRTSRAEVEAELGASGFELVHWADSPYGHAVARAR